MCCLGWSFFFGVFFFLFHLGEKRGRKEKIEKDWMKRWCRIDKAPSVYELIL